MKYVIINRAPGQVSTEHSIATNMKKVAKDFLMALDDLMRMYSDPNEDLVVGGLKVASKDKFGVLGTFLLQKETSDLSNQYQGAYAIYNNMNRTDIISKLFS